MPESEIEAITELPHLADLQSKQSGDLKARTLPSTVPACIALEKCPVFIDDTVLIALESACKTLMSLC